MSLLNSSNAISTGGGYNLENSLRFRSSASAYLSRTYGTPTSARIFTLSMWVKRGKLGVFQQLYSGYTDSTNRGFIGFQSGDFIACYVRNSGGDLYEFSTPAVFRDASAWYHVIVAFDTTQATATNRVKVYVNGVQQTLNLTTTTQNVDLSLNTSGSGKSLGQSNGLEFLDGYMTEVNFVDGQALTASDFGETNSTTGVWQPIEYTGTYGTNGFYLPMNQTIETYDADYLVIAGGGSGGSLGGGGAGGYRNSYNSETSGGGSSSEAALTLIPSAVYTVTVGAGATNTNSQAGLQGGNSVISGSGITTITSIGGGFGHGDSPSTGGGNGGSGGGAGAYALGPTGGGGGGGAGAIGATVAGSGNAGGTATVGQGYDGGNGGDGITGNGGAGGSGLASSITGSSVTRAGGGGGAGIVLGGTGGQGAGGSGGGGIGGNNTPGGASGDGAVNTGGGGGAAGYTSAGAFANPTGKGGSGIVILRVPTAKYTGTVTGSPTVTTTGSDTVIQFTASGTYTA
tara:strand:- start:647 stop:2185 length:1539 start_codon:yes stop_codon:yes gene_type:complete